METGGMVQNSRKKRGRACGDEREWQRARSKKEEEKEEERGRRRERREGRESTRARLGEMGARAEECGGGGDNWD